jgi:hypothetical protein
MDVKKSLMWVFGLSFAGACFSGYLAVSELMNKTCPLGTCTAKVGGLPSCVYGFVLFLLIWVFSWLGLIGYKKWLDDESGEEEILGEIKDGNN